MSHNHRRIYEKYNGLIPKDDNGRSYEIHHIDGNHNNNDISNLKCVSIQEHYDIHFAQGDYFACYKIAGTMKMSPQHISFLSSLENKKRVANGTHNLLGGDSIRKRIANGTYHLTNVTRKRVSDGTHNLLGGEIQRKTHQKRKELGETHHFIGSVINQTRIENGTHHCLIIHTCPYCNKVGKGPTMFRFHFNKCKERKS